MRTTTAILVALLGLPIRPHALWAGSDSADVTISVYLEPLAEWVLPEPVRVPQGVEMGVDEEVDPEQLLLAFTNVTAVLTRTVVRSTESPTPRAADTGEMTIGGLHMQVVYLPGSDLVGGAQANRIQLWPGEDTGEIRLPVGEIVEIILTLCWS